MIRKMQLKLAMAAGAAAALLATQAYGQMFSFEDAETVTVGTTTYVGGIDPSHGTPGSSPQPAFVWGDSFDSNQVNHVRDTVGATDGSYSMKVTKPNGDFSWGTQVLFNLENTAKFNALTTSTRMMVDITVLPNANTYQVGFGALNYGGTGGYFLDSYNVAGGGNNYQWVSGPASLTEPSTQTYMFDFGGLMRLLLPGLWDSLTDYVIIHFNNNSTPGANAEYWYDNFRVINDDAVTRPTWQPIAGGNWTDGSSWANGVPNAVGAAAILSGVGASNGSVALNTPVTINSAVSVGSIMFESQICNYGFIGASTSVTTRDQLPADVNYTISGTGSLNLDVATGESEIYVLAGSHAINVPVNVNDNLHLDATGGFGPDANTNLPGGGRFSSTPAPSLTFGGPVNLASGITLRTTGAGSFNFNGGVTGAASSALRGARVNFGSNVNVDAITISPAARVAVTANGSRILRTKALTVGDGSLTGRLDLTNNAAIIDYTGTSPVGAIGAQLSGAYAGGSWTGSGITSSSAAAAAAGTGLKTALGYGEAADLGITSFLGQSVDGDTVLIRYTLYGDANLDRITDIADFAILTSVFNQTNTRWTKGDFNFDNTTDITDFALLTANFNQSLAIPRAAVPEPAALGALAAGSLLLRRRRSNT